MKCMVRLIKYITNKNWTTYEILAFSARILIRNKIFLHFKEYNNIYVGLALRLELGLRA